MVGKIVTLVAIAVALFYVFKNPKGTATLISNVGTVFSGGVSALQGRNTA